MSTALPPGGSRPEGSRAGGRRLRGLLGTGSVLGAVALLTASCAAAPSLEEENKQSNTDYTGCIVSDSGGFDDRSFNQNSYEGLMKAKADYGIRTKQAESAAVTDFEPNIASMLRGGCDMITTVGFNLSDATKAAAQANPGQKFMIIDDNQIQAKNVRPIIFDTSQAAFLGGYLAAASSRTGTVATFGGMEIPTVTIFMDGFAQGVEYYNQHQNGHVRLLGWDYKKQTGTFTGDFEDVGKGKTTTQNFLNEGADVVMPVAGPVGNGAVDAVNGFNSDEPAHEAKLIWVDSDGYETLSAGKQYVLSSVVKKMGEAVESTIKDDLDGKYTAEPYVGTLQNEGVGITPYHDQAGSVSGETDQQLQDLKKKIVAGQIVVKSKASPLNGK